jgi:hypothetical protein
MSVNRLYLSWVERITRIKTMAWLMTGIFASHSVHLSQIANKISGPACLNSHIQRLSRFLNNAAVQVRAWYEPIAVSLLERIVSAGQEVRVVVEGSKIGFGPQLLRVAVCYRRRALPLAWTWVKGKRGHSSTPKQLALLA